MTGRPRAPGGFPAREAELGRIRVVLSAAREGDGALVVDGERGIGRTALLERVCGALEGERLLRVTGPEFEAKRRRVHEVLSRSLPRGFPCRVRRVGAA